MTKKLEVAVPQAEQHLLNHQKLLVLLIKNAGVQEGFWMLSVEMQFGAINAGADEAHLFPTGLISISRIGIARTTVLNGLSADAAAINGQTAKKRSAAKAKTPSAKPQARSMRVPK